MKIGTSELQADGCIPDRFIVLFISVLQIWVV